MKQRGGKREGSGRKAKDPTTTINFRVPADKKDYLKPLVSQYIKSLLGSNSASPIEVKPPAKVTTPKSKTNPPKEPTMAELLRQSSILK